MANQLTLRELLAAGRGEAVALSAPGAKELSYDALRNQISRVGIDLKGIGIGAGDRVAIVLPNGPEMATAFMGVASVATSAPLNPGYRADELEFFFADLGAKALIIDVNSDSPAADIARKLNIPILTLEGLPTEGAGCFKLHTTDLRAGADTNSRPSGADDIALVLHTSGTTSRPKIVPLSQHNICASARNIRPQPGTDRD